MELVDQGYWCAHYFTYILFIKDNNPQYEIIFDLGSIFLIGFFSIGYFYWVATKQFFPVKTGRYFMKTFPTFLTVSMGLSLHNAIAVMEGLLGYKSPFNRTPKFNILKKEDSWTGNSYIKPKITIGTIVEGVLSLYFIFGIFTGFVLEDYGLMIFHFMLALGFLAVFYHSVRPLGYDSP
jgi:hypothetical protein